MATISPPRFPFSAIVRVGNGRGVIVSATRDQRYIVTAATVIGVHRNNAFAKYHRPARRRRASDLRQALRVRYDQ